MRIHEIIREKRKSLGLTQEQAAVRLGITASAFNKWERGISYPDITILPALARLLETDLNTLLSFREELTDQEIALWCRQIADVFLKDGFEAAYQQAIEKVCEYPGSGKLLFQIAGTLEGELQMFSSGLEEEKKQKYLEVIETLYERAAQSKDDAARIQANTMLALKYMNRGEYEKAQEKIELLPDPALQDKRQLQAQLYYRQGRYEEAAQLEEGKILKSANGIYTDLMLLMGIALKEKRMEDARYFVEKAVQTVQLYEMWEYSAWAAEFQMAVSMRDKEKTVQVLKQMLPSLKQVWRPSEARLYSHIPQKEGSLEKGAYRERMLGQIVGMLKTDEEMEFLREDEEFSRLLRRYTDQTE